MNKKQENSKQLEQAWEQAIQDAMQESSREIQLDRETLDSAAGLQIKSGVRSGDWTSSLSCNNTCTF